MIHRVEGVSELLFGVVRRDKRVFGVRFSVRGGFWGCFGARADHDVVSSTALGKKHFIYTCQVVPTVDLASLMILCSPPRAVVKAVGGIRALIGAVRAIRVRSWNFIVPASFSLARVNFCESKIYHGSEETKRGAGGGRGRRLSKLGECGWLRCCQ